MSSIMANVTVSVPEELKKRMDHTEGINWSQIARKAFEEAVKRREMGQAAEAMDRLRESIRSSAWSGAREIRKWRDTKRQS